MSDRYAVFDEIASGGMATVHFGRQFGEAGFSRTVAVKKLHPGLTRDPALTAMLLDEARLVSRIRHPSVVPTLDVVADRGELFIVMEYVEGEALTRLIRGEHARPSLGIALSVMTDVLHGLHAAHEAKGEQGKPLDIVHRDVSPQNILVGRDGTSRLLDFGIAKAVSRAQTTRDGAVKGKLGYLSPEQIAGARVDRRTDVFAASIVLWETLTGRRLFGEGDTPAAVIARILCEPIAAPSSIVPGLPQALDAIVLKGLSRTASDRFTTAREMALALESVAPHATRSEISAWVESVAGPALAARAARMAEIEGGAVDVRSSDAAGALSRTLVAAAGDAISGTAPTLMLDAGSAARPSRTTGARRALARVVLWAVAPTVVVVVVALLVLRRDRQRGTDRITDLRIGAGTALPGEVAPPEPKPAAPAPMSAERPVASSSPTRDVARGRPMSGGPAHAKPATSTRRLQCDPPYFIDSSGVKRFRADCF